MNKETPAFDDMSPKQQYEEIDRVSSNNLRGAQEIKMGTKGYENLSNEKRMNHLMQSMLAYSEYQSQLAEMRTLAEVEGRELNSEYVKLIDEAKRATDALQAFQKEQLGMNQEDKEEGNEKALEEVRGKIENL